MTTTGQRTSTELEATVPVDSDDSTDAPSAGDDASTVNDPRNGRISWKRILAFGLLPALALTLGSGAAYLRWQDSRAQMLREAAVQSTQAATESAIAMLSYRPDSVDKDLHSASNRMNGKFRDDYNRLINDVVIPGAKEKRVSAVAKVPAAASVSASENHALVMTFVDQTVTIGDDAPTDTASTVRVTLDKVDGRWLISQFEPI